MTARAERPRVQHCSRCCVEHTRPKQRYCKACHAAYTREWRKTHALSAEQRRKAECRWRANALQKLGELVPQPCRTCGASKVEKHHPDYSKPLNVIWLCRPCHLRLHREMQCEPVAEAA